MHKLLTKILARPLRGLVNNRAIQQRMSLLFEWLYSSPHGREILSRLFRKSAWYYLVIARRLRQQGDDQGAFLALMDGQRCPVDDYRIHIRLSEIYRDNGDVMAAHMHLKIADVLKPGYSTIRLLTFESDHGLHENGSKTMAKALGFSQRLVRRHITMLNRISIFYPQYAEKLDVAREKFKNSLQTDSYTNPAALSEAVNQAIANRWLHVALDICQNTSVEPDPTTRKLLDRLTTDLGDYELLLELGWKNETHDELTAVFRNEAVSLSDLDSHANQIVELFIPTLFFASPDTEKPTYGTIRRTFVEAIRFLMANRELVIVPRFQLYWKYCLPKTKGTHVISYHTSAPVNPRHLHVQESPLAGCCSFDNSGFAGFSSIATDHEQIIRFVSGVSDEILETNQRDMYNRYVTTNVSKYQQPSGSEPIAGAYVFVALQIPTDIVSRLAWISGIDLLKSAVDFYRGTGVRVVVKRHPFCGSMGVQKCLDQMEAAGEIIRTENSIHSLITSAQLVLTVNSGVGLEALIHGKTVIVSGSCDYSYAAKTVRNSHELSQVLSDAPLPDTRRIGELLYFYVNRFSVPAANAALIHARLGEWLSSNELQPGGE